MKLKKSAAIDLVRLCCRVLDEKKAGELSVFDVSAQSSITDYLILATATSEPHLRALRIELEKAFDEARVRLVGMEAAQESGWVVLDAFDVMVHLFLAPVREHYALDRLWQDATEVPIEKVLHSPAAKRPVRRPRRVAAAAKAPKRAPRRS
jgi:ribosome-associated protein